MNHSWGLAGEREIAGGKEAVADTKPLLAVHIAEGKMRMSNWEDHHTASAAEDTEVNLPANYISNGNQARQKRLT